MSGSPFGILEAWSAHEQSDAMSGASQLQYNAYMQSIDNMMQMWQQAQDDFAPYLSAGNQGLLNLQTSMPQYMQNVVMPAAQQYSSYQNTQTPAANWSINPVTGEYTPGTQTLQQGQAPVNLSQLESTPYNPGQGNGFNVDEAGAGLEIYPYKPNGPESRHDLFMQSQQGTPKSNTLQGGQTPIPGTSIDMSNVIYSKNGLMGRAQNAITPRSTPGQMGAVATPEQLQQGGVFSPAIPEFQRSLSDFQFNADDPVYQQKLSEKNKQIDRFLAKQGLQGSSAGEEFRQNEMNKLLSEEEGRQYSRAKTERDYMTQTDIEKYGLGAQRGETLYGRTMGQQQSLYDRMVQGALRSDQQALDQLQRQYGTSQNLYGLLYAAGLDLSKLGAGAAGSAGAGSITTGQNVGQQYGLAGQAQAQGALGQSAIWANYASGMGNNMGNVAGSIWQNWGSGGGGANSGGGGYYGGGGGGYYGNYGVGGTGGYGPGGSDNWANYV